MYCLLTISRAHSQEFIDQSCMAEHIASMLESREKSAEDEPMECPPEESQDVSMEDTPGESLDYSPGKHSETSEETPEETLEKASDDAPEVTAAETPWENLEESQYPNLGLDLLYDVAPILEVDMTKTESIPIDPELWRLYGESL